MKDREEKKWLAQIRALDTAKTPYLLTDLDVIAEKAVTFKKLMPRVALFYAVKSNNDPRVIKTLKPLVDGFDIASVGEYRQLIELGARPEDMVYSNPVKVPAHIKETFKGGVTYFAIDSLSEIEKLRENAPGSTVYLRVRVSDYGSKFPLSGKFGLDPMHAVAFAETAKEAGLQVKGITFHVGSQAENPHVWEAALKMAGGLIEDLERAGVAIEFLDIGGGFPASYEELAPTIKEAAEVINKGLEAHIPSHIRVFGEPGRYISANASVMVASVIGREHRSGTDWLYLDVGVFQGLIEPLEMSDWKYPIFTGKHPDGYQKSFVLTGPTCDAYDTLGLDYMLPSDLNVGDHLYIGAAGAYTSVYASQFNGFEPPKRYYVKRGGK